MERMTPADKQALIIAIATREGTARQLALWYDLEIPQLRQFTEDNLEAIERARQAWEDSEQDPSSVSPSELSELWISDKSARLQRIERVAGLLYRDIVEGTRDATTLRELRSYMALAANELGQLLHRGAGDSGSDTLNVDIEGVDFENLR